jgi:hypothetical protein
VEFWRSAFSPRAVLKLPVVLLKSATAPVAVLLKPIQTVFVWQPTASRWDD